MDGLVEVKALSYMIISRIIWQTPQGFVTDFDLEFLKRVLFKYVPTDFYFDEGKLIANENKSMIVYSCNQNEISQEFKRYLLSIKNYSLCHLSNESLNHNCSYYKKAQIVLRSYFDPLINANNVFSIPL